ncbi:DNRLRE domain-containing protein [Micromonospora chalcea]|uniref:DNRLRE domain-containing protein n=1 Tax=Micromonospora chalcea TaxID=1874 RepID=UPI00142D8C71|nr:DNRLRE domain-containing protein [Micromonospora chalcea]
MSLVMAAVLAATSAGPVIFDQSAATAEAGSASEDSAQSGVLQAADEASAMRLAYRSRKPVLVSDATTEVSRSWAQPDGTVRAELSAAPVRARNAAGQWADLDLALQKRSDGSVAPKLDARGLWLSGARSAEADALAAAGSGASRVALGWRGVLPEPTLDGTTATYAEVKPGVDLMVEARRSGFAYSFRVRTPAAAASVSSISLPWSVGAGAAAARSAVTAAGDAPVTVSQGEMWDARTLSSGEPQHRADVKVAAVATGGGVDLVMTPDPVFYQDPKVTYPVTIDPSVNLGPAFDGYVQDTIANTDKSGDTTLKLGYVVDANEGCPSGCKARTLMNFQRLGGLDGAQVISAELFLWNYHSYSCNPAGWESWLVSWADSSARWGTQPSWLERDGTSTGTKGYGGCADGWVSVSVKKSFQAAFDSVEQQWALIGLRASSESSSAGWKKFNSSEASAHTPYVTLVYNRTPNVPTGLKIDSCYSACSSPAVVRSGTPQLTATVSDPDGGTLRAEYAVFNSTKGTLMAKSGTAVTGVASGTARPWKVVPLSGKTLPDGVYFWRVRACDATTCSDTTGWFQFTVNTQDPSLPSVSATAYPPKDTGTWSGGPGQAGSFTFGSGSASDVSEYIYSVNQGNAVTVAAGAPQAEKLTANQQQVSSNLTGFTAGGYATIARSTARGHNSSDSLQITPTGTGGTAGAPFTYATVGGDNGGLRLGMQPGKRYLVTGWIYVPAATGLTVTDWRGLAIVPIYMNAGSYTTIASNRPTATDTWQKLSIVVTVPTTATEAFVRLYNGMTPGSGKTVFWDDLSLREVTGTSTVESITPVRDGLNVLQVQSRNAAGATSDPRVYEFLVTPSSNSWAWTFDDDQGKDAASVPAGFPAVYSGTTDPHTRPGRIDAAAATLDGTGVFTTASPVLNTSAVSGFTVAAWVRIPDDTALAAPYTAVAQNGVATSMFTLGYRTDRDVTGDGTPDPAWCFTVATSDSATSGRTGACTGDYVAPGDWVSLVGSVDPTNGLITLYVNGPDFIGGTKATAAYVGGWSAIGPLTLGGGFTGTERWLGDVDHVYASQYVWDEFDVLQFAFQ